jgi:peptide/nickel transport system substrate-binding protein
MRRPLAPLLALLLAAGCAERPACPDCGTLVIAATGEPTTLLPVLVADAVGRDVSDLVFERLATLAPGGSPNDPAAFRPGLATRWSRADSVTWRFTLRPGAIWQDSQPVTSADVVFSFEAFVDTTFGAPASALVGRATAIAEGDSAVLVRFREPANEMLFDATYYVRILPRHVWANLVRTDWAADTAIARLIGSGPFHVTHWAKGQSLTLTRDPIWARPADSAIQRIVWRFAGDQDAALNLVLAGQAHLVETVTSPSGRERVAADPSLRELPYPAAVYGFVGLTHRSAGGAAHPLLGARAVRRALTYAIDRPTLVKAVIGPDAVVPPGPMSRAIWIWDDSIGTLPYDTTAANRLLDSLRAGRGPDGLRRLRGRRMAIDILVPATSLARRRLAEGIQQMWRQVGVAATVTAVDFPVFQQRLARGRFEAMIGAWLDEPSPRSLAEQWTRAGWGALNYGRYASAAFDSLFALASRTAAPVAARALWREAMDTLAADAAAIFLYTPTSVAVASRRLLRVAIDPFSWLSGAPDWLMAPPP